MSQVFEPVEHITVWVDGGIHIKTTDPQGDPVEMSEEEALALAALLRSLVEEGRR
jgi:hypothetical protein